MFTFLSWILWGPLLVGWFICEVFIKITVEVYQGIRGNKKAKPHGDAEWADLAKLRKAGNLEPQGFKVGKLNGKSVYTHRERSLLMFGPPGAGKSLTFSSSIREASGCDMIIYDPAAGVLGQCRDKLETAGYEVRVIDLNRPTESAAYNPLTFLNYSTPLTLNRDVQALSSLLCPIVNDSEIGGHFGRISQRLIGGTIKHLRDTDPRRATLPYAAEKLCANATRRRIMFSEMERNPDVSVQMAVAAFNEAGDREKGSFATTMFDRMEIWADAGLKMCMDGDWSWEDVFTDIKPVAVFINGGLGASHLTGAYARLLIGNAINTVRRSYNLTGKPLHKGLKIYVDEAVNIGRCDAVLDGQRELRKAGVRVAMAYIDRSDMQQVYGKAADMLINSADAIVTGGMRDLKYLQEMVELIGRNTQETYGQSEGRGGESQSKSQFGRPLISTDELVRLPQDEVVALLGSLSTRLKKPWQVSKGGVTY